MMNWKNMMKWKELLKLPKKTQLILLFLVGLLLLVIALPTKRNDSSNDAYDTTNETSKPSVTSTDVNEYADYEEMLENRVEQSLEEVDGVGHVSVMLTLKSSTEQVIEKDSVSESQTTDSQSQSSSSKTSVYRQDSDGSQTPYVKKELTPVIEGVIVIADGGDDSVVVQNITEAIQALFGVEAHKIKIMKRSDT